MIKSQSTYCPLARMFCLRQSNKMIKFKNFQVLMTEICKIVNDAAPPIMKSLLQFRLNQYNLRHFQELSTGKRNTVNYGPETLIYRAPAIWAKLPSNYVLATSLDEFKLKITFWKCENCPCRLCKKYQPNLRYIN